METQLQCLNQYDLRHLLTLPEEELLISKRKHWIVTLIPIVTVLFICLMAIVSISGFFLIYLSSIILAISSTLLITEIGAGIIIKIIADWYYHIFIITTRRILELEHAPLFSEQINDVILDQVRITEIDVKIRSVIEELLNIGDVIIAFDRPSHQETFSLCKVRDPGAVGAALADRLELLMHEMPIWFNRSRPEDIYKFSQDIEPAIS